MEQIYEFADYLTVNISSPNTKDLRSLHDEEKLPPFLENKKSPRKARAKDKKLTLYFLRYRLILIMIILSRYVKW